MPPTRDRIVAAAAELFHRQGFHATSLAAVQKKADVRGGSVYYFFKTKEELLEAALERYAEILDPRVVEPAFATSDDPVERIFRVLDVYRQALLDSDFEIGCPIGNLAIETSEAGPEARRLLSANLDLWTARIATCLEEIADLLPPALDRTGLATFILTTMEGAVLVARGHRRIEPFDAAVSHLRDYLERLLGERRTAATRSRRSNKQ